MLDCGDSSCYFATGKGGMRTNGGCRCFSNAGFNRGMHAAARELLLEVLKLREEVAKHEGEVRRIAAAVRLAEFEYVLGYRPMDPCYWDMHRRNELVAGIKAASEPSR